MFYKINKLFFKISSQFKLILIKILFFSIFFFNSEPAFSKVTNFERDLAYKYCKSIESNMFKGLDNERILKYEYFFNSINIKEIKEETDLVNFTSEVENICSYKLNIEEKEDFKRELKIYLSDNLR